MLLTIVAHPCTTAFPGTWEIVYIEDTELGTIDVFYFKHFYIKHHNMERFQKSGRL